MDAEKNVVEAARAVVRDRNDRGELQGSCGYAERWRTFVAALRDLRKP